MKIKALVSLILFSLSCLAFPYDSFSNDILVMLNRSKAEIRQLLEKKITKSLESNKYIKKVKKIEHNITEVFPHFRKTKQDKYYIELPGDKGYQVRVRATVKHRFFEKDVDIVLKKLKISRPFDLSIEKDFSVSIKEAEKPYVDIKFKIEWGKGFGPFLINIFENLLSSLFYNYDKNFEEIIRKEVKKSVADVIPSLQKLLSSRLGNGDDFKDYHPREVQNINKILDLIEDKTFLTHYKYGTFVTTVNRNEINTTWAELDNFDYKSHYEYDGLDRFEDSAIWSGYFLSSLSLHYNQTQDQKVLKRIKLLLRGIEKLITFNSSGILSRIVVPKNSDAGQIIIQKHKPFESHFIDDIEYISFQGDKGISRDQYLGVAFGLYSLHKFVDNEDTKTKAKELYSKLITYLINCDFNITEDAARTIPGTKTVIPTSWATNPTQKLALLLITQKLVPNHPSISKVRKEIKRLLNDRSYFWLNVIPSITDPTKAYFGHNLFYTTSFLLIDILKDGTKKEKRILSELMDGLKIMRKYLGHHQNAWFDLVSYYGKDVLPLASTKSLKEKIKKELTSSLHRPTQYNDFINHSDITIGEETFVDIDGNEKTIASSSIVPEYGVLDPNFFYQRAPFYVRKSWGLDRERTELSGMDITLTFWLAKYLDVID